MRVALLLVVLCLAAYIAFAANSPSPAREVVSPSAQKIESKDGLEQPKEPAPKAKRAKDMTVQELAEAITKVLNHSNDIMDYVPGYKLEKDAAGNSGYTYKGVKLENLEKDKLVGMYNRVRQERVRLNTERINRQLDSIRTAQQADSMARQVLRVTNVPVPSPQPQQPPQAPPRSIEPPRTPPPAPRR